MEAENLTAYEEIYRRQTRFFAGGATYSYSFRLEQLKLLKKTVKKYEKDITT